MRQVARMLGWTTTLIGFVFIVLLGSIGYSLFDTLMFKQGIGLGEFQLEWVEGDMRLSIPLIVNNTSPFPMSNVALMTNISDHRGIRITGNETVLPYVPEGSVDRATQILHLRMVDVFSDGSSYLLFNDSQLQADIALRFTYAHLVTLKFQLPNMSFPWGAPLYNLSVGKPTDPASFNATHYKVHLPLSFENHAPLTLVTIQLKLLNDQRERLASKTTTVNVRPMEGFSDSVEIFIKERDLQRLTERGFVQFYLQTSEFNFGPAEMPYG